MAREAVADGEEFIAEVCWHYYVNEMTQGEIAQVLDVTRLRVNQAIQRAKALGIIKIQIESPFLARFELQKRLVDGLGIQRAVVSPANTSEYEFHRGVGAALAEHLSERLRQSQWRSFGVSWGLTLDAAIRKLQRQTQQELEVVSILGGTAHGSSFNSFGVAAGFADALGARYSILTAPIYLPSGVDRDVFLSHYALQEHFRKFEQLDAVLLTCSDVSAKSYLVAHGLPQGITVNELTAQGAIGDVLGRFLDKDGNSVSPEIDDRAIGMTLDRVLQVPEKILCAAGPHKVEIIRAACKRKLVDTLITDDVTAGLLLAAAA